MKISSWIYNIGQGFKNILRNRMFSLASVATMTACLFLFGIFVALTENFNYIMKQTEKIICITVFFENDITEDEIGDLRGMIEARSEVYRVDYTSAEEAWEMWKKEHFQGYEELIDGFKDDNPLANSASFEIYLNDIEQQDSMVAYLKTLDGVRTVNSSKSAAQSLGQMSQIIGIISVVIVAVLLFVAIFLISNTVTVGVTVRKEEIGIMKLIGATDRFVRAPFMVEGVVIGLLGSIIPIGLVYVCYDYAVAYLVEKNNIIMGSVELIKINDIFLFLVPAILLIGVGIGYGASRITISKHLKV